MRFPDDFTLITDEVSQELDEVLAFVREFRLPGIELRSLFGKAFKDLEPADVKQVAEACREAQLKVFSCASPVLKCEIGDGTGFAEHRDILKRSLDIAAELGCGLVRVFTFLRRDPRSTDDDIARAAEGVGQLLPLAEPYGIRLGVENEASCVVGTGGELAGFLDRMPSPSVGAVWDPCNPLYLEALDGPATEGWEAVAPRTVHVHIKDATRRRDAAGKLLNEAQPMGRGDVGWAGHLEQIDGAGYRGLFSLETHYRVEQLAAEDLHLPAGYAFSAGGEAASRLCFDLIPGLIEGMGD